MSPSKMVVGVDGSEHSARAVQWCAKHAVALDAEVVAVHVIDIPVYVTPVSPFPMPPVSQEQRDEFHDLVARDWVQAVRRRWRRLFGLEKNDFIPQVEDIITVGEFYAIAAGGQIIFT